MENSRNLALIWSSADREVVLNMIFMYAHNSMLRDWWDQVRLIIWGPSQKLLVEDSELQEEIREMAFSGVEIWACQACSDRYACSSDLSALGVEVFHVGESFTTMLQSNEWKVLTL